MSHEMLLNTASVGKRGSVLAYCTFIAGALLGAGVTAAVVLLSQSRAPVVPPSPAPGQVVGIVSNVFNAVRNGSDPSTTLPALIARLKDEFGFKYVELRQSTLGSPYEGPGPEFLPSPENIRQLVNQFPSMRFNYAFSYPYMTRQFSLSQNLTDLALETALQISENSSLQFPLLLRVVDTSTTNSDIPTLDQNAIIVNLVALADRVKHTQPRGLFVVENARVHWEVFNNIMTQAGAAATNLQYCYDPANLVAFAGDAGIPGGVEGVTSGLDVSRIAMVHAKQPLKGKIVSTIPVYGDVNWRKQAAALRRLGYSGVLLLETDPSLEVFEDLWQSLDNLQAAGII